MLQRCNWDVCIRVRWKGAFQKPKFESDSFEMLIFRICRVSQNIYVFSLYRNTDNDDSIFYFY